MLPRTLLFETVGTCLTGQSRLNILRQKCYCYYPGEFSFFFFSLYSKETRLKETFWFQKQAGEHSWKADCLQKEEGVPTSLLVLWDLFCASDIHKCERIKVSWFKPISLWQIFTAVGREQHSLFLYSFVIWRHKKRYI